MITVETTVNAPVDKVWQYWTQPEHITQWAFASDDWEAPRAENDVREGGKFTTVMAAKDGSASFDLTGTYTTVEEKKQLNYIMADDRKVETTFESNGDTTKIVQSFDPENENPEEMQRGGWQAILDNFKKHVEEHAE